ncbi:MAG: DUF423 domain-containing protein [Parachlamydiaceae bacterium]
MIKLLTTFGAIFALTAVILGAFGAHALKEKLASNMLNTFEVGVRYQMYHALALFILAWLTTLHPHFLMVISGYTMILGTCIFSGSLYLLVFSGWRFFGAITPVGGLLLVISWLLLLIRLCLK